MGNRIKGAGIFHKQGLKMDRGQIFIGLKLSGIDHSEELNQFLAEYGYRWDDDEYEAVRIDGERAKYQIHWNSETGLFVDGNTIFGIEAVAAYVNFSEPGMGGIPTSISSGYSRDWVQEIDLEKLAELHEEVKRDIPGAKVLLMDMHY